MKHYLVAPVDKSNEPSVLSEGLLQKFGQGLTFGWRDELSAKLQGMLTDTFNPLYAKQFGEETSYENSLAMQRRSEQAYGDANPLAAGAAELAGAVTTGIATGGVAARLGAAGLLPTAGIGMVEGGIYGAGAANEGDRVLGAAKGALIGGIAAPVGYGLGQMTSRVINTMSKLKSASPATAKAVTQGESLGFKYTPAQKTADDTLKLVEGGFKKDPATVSTILRDKNANELVANRLAAKSIGEDASDLSVDVIDSAFTRLGREFEDLGGLDAVRISGGNVKQTKKLINDYSAELGKPKAPSWAKDFSERLTVFSKDGLPAAEYQKLHANLGRILANKKATPDTIKLAGGMRDVLNDAVEKSLPASALPRWQAAREQWGNLQTLMKSGVIRDDNVSPAVLANKLRQRDAKKYLSGGRDELSDVARFGSLATRFQPSSQTAEGLMAGAANRKILPDILPRLKANLYMKYPQLFTPENISTGGGETAGLLSIIEQTLQEMSEGSAPN